MGKTHPAVAIYIPRWELHPNTIGKIYTKNTKIQVQTPKIQVQTQKYKSRAQKYKSRQPKYKSRCKKHKSRHPKYKSRHPSTSPDTQILLTKYIYKVFGGITGPGLGPDPKSK